MTFHQGFSNSVQEKLDYYVYLLIDPITDNIFYVGKGNGNRVFDHANAALSETSQNEKLDRIREIISLGHKVKYVIHRHGLTPETAFEVEAALIDFIGMEDLTNIVQGHNSDDRGRMSIEEIIAKYNAQHANIQEPMILITINRLYKRNMTSLELYNATRGNWVIGERRQKAQYACSVANGIIRAVYKIDKWESVITNDTKQKQNKRWRFEGIIAENLGHYVSCSTVNYTKIGAQNPIRYINC